MDLIESQKRILACEERIDIVYQRLVDLAARESFIENEFDRMTKVSNEFSDIEKNVRAFVQDECNKLIKDRGIMLKNM